MWTHDQLLLPGSHVTADKTMKQKQTLSIIFVAIVSISLYFFFLKKPLAIHCDFAEVYIYVESNVVQNVSSNRVIKEGKFMSSKDFQKH